MIRLVVADDQALIRDALIALLRSDPELEVVAQAADGVQAVAAARRHRPDVVVMDVRMPGLDGLRATARIREELPDTAVLVLTTYDLDEYVFSAIRAGAAGFLLKDGDGDELVRAIKACTRGEAVMAPGALRRLFDEFTRHPTSDPEALELVDRLSAREREVLGLMAAGLSNDEISRELVIGLPTVKTHVGAVLAKLGARDRTQAVVTAFAAGLSGQGDPPRGHPAPGATSPPS